MKITLEWLSSQQVELVGNGREARLNCPNCDDTNKHLYVNAQRSLWYCFKCGKGGKVEFTQRLEPNIEMYSKLMSGDSIIISNSFEKTALETLDKIKSLPLNKTLLPIEIAEDCESSQELIARNYLHSRGVTQREITEHSIRLSLEKHGPYRHSIIFPVYRTSKSSNMEYFVCRKYDNSKPKYVNAPWPKGDALFIADANTGGPNYPSVICEGILDALAIRRVGYNAVALLGKVPTSQQLKRLVQSSQYLIYLDDDAFSQAINLKLQLNAVGTKAKIVVHKMDAAQLYLEDAPLLRSLLDGSTKQLNEFKK